MARKTKNPASEPAGETDEESQPMVVEVDSLEEEQLAKISQITADNALKDGDVLVFRRGRNDQRTLYVATINIDEFSVDDCVARFGGGRFSFRFRNALKRIVTSSTFDADPRLKGSIDDGPAPSPVVTMAAATDNKDVMGVLMSMLAQSQQAATQANSQMVSVVTAALANRNEPPNILGQLAPLVSAFAPLLARAFDNKGPIASVKDVLDVIQHAKEIGGSGGEGGGSDMSAILQTISALAQRGAQAPQPDTITPAPAALPAPSEPDGQVTGAGGTLDMNFLISQYARAQLGRFLKAAQRDTDPESYADVMLDEMSQLPPAYAAQLLKMLQDANWRQLIFGQNPLPYDPWFVELREALLADQTADDKPEQKTTE